MIETKNYTYDRAYFAAANGYTGFRSYFDEIFDPTAMSRIFVLKGGPGTGKSTLLKGLLVHAGGRGYKREAIYCSSDPNSLDGVILTEGGRRVAVIDGTAPHERDATLPGAADELVNLAEGFDVAKLTERREDICRIAKEKKRSYASAYSHLLAAGAVYEDIKHKYSVYANYIEAESKAKKIAAAVAEGASGTPGRILTSAFGSRGYTRLVDGCESGRRSVRISGDGVGEHILMQFLCDILRRKHALTELHISPLSDSIVEAALTDTHVFTLSDTPADVDVSCSAALEDKALAELFSVHGRLLELARAEFSAASARHFELEDIYTGAVDFTHNDAVFLKLTARIDDILKP